MTNGEKFKEMFGVSQVDEGELYAYAWLPNHNAIEIPPEWWNAEYKEPKVGHWIEYTRILIPEPINKWEQAWYCSACGYGNQECEDGSAWLEWKYCPNCGAKMIDPQAE